MISFNKRKLVAVPHAALACLILLATGSSIAFAQQSTEPVIATGQLMVSVAAGTSLDSVKQIAERNGCELLSTVPYTPDCYVFAVKDRDVSKQWDNPTPSVNSALVSLKTANSVVSASLNVRVMPTATSVNPNDPMLDRMWGLRMIRMPEAWAIQEGKPVTVAVLDTGVDATHPEFVDKSGASVLVKAADFVGDGSGAAADPVGHGTHVAGTIGAVTDNGVGVPSVAGWQRGNIRTTIMPVRVLGLAGGTNAMVVSGINYAVLQGAKVINMSLGAGPQTGPPAPEEVTAINNAVAQGVVVVVAAGNSSTNSETGQFFYPADIPGVIKVSAVGPTKNVAPYSNYGRIPNPQLIAAPGGDQSTKVDDGIWSLKPANQYEALQGTSMACPICFSVAPSIRCSCVRSARCFR